MNKNRPKIVVSSCLNGENVRYDGKAVDSSLVKTLSKYVDIISVCPEVSIGLPVPREPIVVVRKNDNIKIVNPKTQEDFTERLEEFSKNFIKNLKDVDGFLLKSKSPSCGVSGTKTYKNENGTGFLYRRYGTFAKNIKNTFKYYPVEDELRLKNPDRLLWFLFRIFILSKLKSIKDIKELIGFHKKHEDVLSLLGKAFLERAEKILSKEADFKEIKNRYIENFLKSSYKLPFSKRTGKSLYKTFEEKKFSDIIPKPVLDMVEKHYKEAHENVKETS